MARDARQITMDCLKGVETNVLWPCSMKHERIYNRTGLATTAEIRRCAEGTATRGSYGVLHKLPGGYFTLSSDGETIDFKSAEEVVAAGWLVD